MAQITEMRIQTKEDLICDVCGYEGKSKIELDSHRREPHECNYPNCTKIARNAPGLKSHKKQRHKSKPMPSTVFAQTVADIALSRPPLQEETNEIIESRPLPYPPMAYHCDYLYPADYPEKALVGKVCGMEFNNELGRSVHYGIHVRKEFDGRVKNYIKRNNTGAIEMHIEIPPELVLSLGLPNILIEMNRKLERIMG